VKTAIAKSASLTINAAAATTFLISGIPNNAVVNAAYLFTVTAKDAFGNTATNYLGSVLFSVEGGTALLPVPYSFTSADKGRHSFTVRFQSPGPNQSLTVTDQVNSLVTATRSGINVT
jgi:hypothetical protein